MQKVFRLRTCEDTVFANRTRPCLLYQIKRCSGPCVDYISPEDYARDVANAERFLQGEQQELMDSLQAQMMARAEALQFEQAAEIRNQIGSLSRVLHQQAVEDNTGGRAVDADILAVKVDGGRACVNLAMVRGGRHLGDRPYFPKHVDERDRRRRGRRGRRRGGGAARADDAAARARRGEVARGARARGLHRPALPRRRHAAAAGRQPRGRQDAGRDARGAQRRAGDRAAPAARAAPRLARHVHQGRRAPAGAAARRGRLAAGAHARPGRRARPRRRGPARLSHRVLRRQPHRRRGDPGVVRRLRGAQDAELAVPALQHRRHHAGRRLRRHAPGAGAPLRQARRGGGAGQRRGCPTSSSSTAGAARSASRARCSRSSASSSSRIVGVEKGEARKVGLEELVFADGRPKVALGRDSAALMLVAQIRDEAHRFAITGMRARRASVRTGASSLEEIPGVGPKKRARLLQRFGGARGVGRASVEDLLDRRRHLARPRRGDLPCPSLTRRRRAAARALARRRPAGLALRCCRPARPSGGPRARRRGRAARRVAPPSAPAPPTAAAPPPPASAAQRCPPPKPRPQLGRGAPAGGRAAGRRQPRHHLHGPRPRPAARDPGARDRAQRRRQHAPDRGAARAAPGEGHAARSPSTRCAAPRRSATCRACRGPGSSSRPSCSTTTASSSRARSIAESGLARRRAIARRLRHNPAMFFNLPTLLTWARIVAIPLVVGVYYTDLPAGDAEHRRHRALHPVRAHRLGRRLAGAQAEHDVVVRRLPRSGRRQVPGHGGAARAGPPRPAARPHRARHHRPRDRDLGAARMDGADRRVAQRRGAHARQGEDRGADDRDPVPALPRHAVRARSTPSCGAPC